MTPDEARLARELWMIEDANAMRQAGASEEEIAEAQAGFRAALDRMD